MSAFSRYLEDEDAKQKIDKRILSAVGLQDTYDFMQPPQEQMPQQQPQQQLPQQSPPQEQMPQQPPPQPQEQMPQQQPPQQMPQQSPQPQQAPPNPDNYGLQFARGLLSAKQSYDNARTDEGRQLAHDQAEFLRAVANAAGIDVSGYGEGVSLKDARKNLASREAQEIAEVVRGKYAMTSDQYYEREYQNALASGLNRNRAQRLAGSLARQYQAERVTYLDRTYNSYGRDGRVTNEMGNQFLGMLSNENPTLANFYATIYPNQKEAYTRDNQLEDKFLDSQNAIAQLIQAYQNQLGLQNNAARLNEEAQDADVARKKDYYAFTSDVDAQKALAMKQRQFEQQIGLINKYLPENLRPAATAAVFGVTLKSGTGESSDKEAKFLTETWRDAQKNITAQRNALTNQYKDNLENMPQEAKAQLAELDKDWQELENAIKGITGLQGQKNKVQEFSDNEAVNNATLAVLWEYSGGNMATYKENVKTWLDKSGVTPHFKEQYLKNLKPYR